MTRPSTTTLWGGFAFGAAGLLAPRALRRSYGAATNPEAETVLRMWGVRLAQTAALGALLDHDDRLRRRGMQVLLVSNAVDIATVLAAGAAGSLPARSAVQIAATDAVFATIALAALGE